jgi:hypothetical protein
MRLMTSSNRVSNEMWLGTVPPQVRSERAVHMPALQMVSLNRAYRQFDGVCIDHRFRFGMNKVDRMVISAWELTVGQPL